MQFCYSFVTRSKNSCIFALGNNQKKCNNMARTKTKAKEPIRLRFKTLANGNKSIYLDIYRGGERSYEFLKMYIVPEKTNADRLLNEETIRAAQAIKAQRLIEVLDNKAGLKSITKGKMLLVDWVREVAKEKEGGYQQQILFTAELIERYGGGKKCLTDVDKAFCSGFVNWLKNEYKTKQGKPLSGYTAQNYYRCFCYAMNRAKRKELITANPFDLLEREDKIERPESQRTYLTVAEVKRLIETPCSNDASKRAYLFSCYCGLRISDVKRLTWGDYLTDGGQARLNIVVKKTKTPLYLPLSERALVFMPDRGEKGDSEPIFDLPTPNQINNVLKKWATAAGINKRLSFHTSRHTFATMGLTAGVPIEVISKLLGHADISTTQIYAKIVDKKKVDAVNLINNLFE